MRSFSPRQTRWSLLGELWSVDPSVADSVPATQRLHRRLSEYEVLNRLCTPFNVSSWVIKTCRRLRDGDASDQERKSLYALLRGEVHISMKAWEAAKRAPFLTDHRGNAAAPVQLVSRRTPNAALLAPALQYPRPVDERHPRFAIFDWRKSLQFSDLVQLARLVESGEVASAVAAEAFARLPRLLTPSAVRSLQDIAFIEAESGELFHPTQIYERSDRLVAALGERAPFAVGWPHKVLATLKVPTLPPVDDVLAALQVLREAELPVQRPDLAYRVLLDAARADRYALDQHSVDQVLWTGEKWEAPNDCLVASDQTSLFRGAVTLLNKSELYRALGVPSKPADPTGGASCSGRRHRALAAGRWL